MPLNINASESHSASSFSEFFENNFLTNFLTNLLDNKLAKKLFDESHLTTYKNIAVMGTSVAACFLNPLFGLAVQEGTSFLLQGHSEVIDSTMALVHGDWSKVESGLMILGATLAMSGGLALVLKSNLFVPSTDALFNSAIVFIDSDPSFCRLVPLMLKKIGRTEPVYVFADALEAQAFMKTTPVKLVIADPMTTLCPLDRLKLLEEWQGPKIFFSAYEHNFIEHIYPSWMFLKNQLICLQKPCSFSEFSTVVRQALSS